MSKYAENIEQKTEDKRRESVRREALSRFYYDLAKLTFAGVVLGTFDPLVKDPTDTRYLIAAVFGIYAVCVFAFLGNRTLKY